MVRVRVVGAFSYEGGRGVSVRGDWRSLEMEMLCLVSLSLQPLQPARLARMLWPGRGVSTRWRDTRLADVAHRVGVAYPGALVRDVGGWMLSDGVVCDLRDATSARTREEARAVLEHCPWVVEGAPVRPQLRSDDSTLLWENAREALAGAQNRLLALAGSPPIEGLAGRVPLRLLGVPFLDMVGPQRAVRKDDRSLRVLRSLACGEGAAVAAGTLAEAAGWPDDPYAAAKLRKTVQRLRQRFAATPGDTIISARFGYALDLRTFALDTVALRDLSARAIGSPTAALAAAALLPSPETLAAIRSDPSYGDLAHRISARASVVEAALLDDVSLRSDHVGSCSRTSATG